MKHLVIALALVLAVAFTLPHATIAKGRGGSGARSSAGSQHGGAAFAAPANGGAGLGSIRGFRGRQPCDLQARGGLIGVRALGAARFDDKRFLIVDAMPSEAQVFLDGHLLGAAGRLIARALPIAPGRHAIEVVAPGFRSYIAIFSTDPSGFPTRIRTRLAPE